MNNQPLVTIKNMRFLRDHRVILDDINCEFLRGKITGIIGPSGIGKTTLLRLIGGQLYPDVGNVFFDGVDIHRLSRTALYNARRRMGMLFQSSGLFTNLTVFENVAFPLQENTDLSPEMIRDIVLMKLEIVGLRGTSQLMTNQLSGGMARRVALARAIAMDPELIMYDEPFVGQDPISKGILTKLIKQLNDILGMTSIIVSHDVKETASIADYIYVISNKTIVGEGVPAQLLKDKTPAVEQFVHGLPDGVVPFHYPASDYIEDLFA